MTDPIDDWFSNERTVDVRRFTGKVEALLRARLNRLGSRRLVVWKPFRRKGDLVIEDGNTKQRIVGNSHQTRIEGSSCFGKHERYTGLQRVIYSKVSQLLMKRFRYFLPKACKLLARFCLLDSVPA